MNPMKPITVVVPVLGRPQNAEPFIDSLDRALSSNLVDRVLVIADSADPETGNVWAKHEKWVSVLMGNFASPDESPRPGTYPEKVNQALGVVGTEWMFLAGDDVRFHDDWASIALAAAVGTKARVIGTNDLANPRTMRGEHSTHTFVHTGYARNRGASWDGPGTVCSEAYHHWHCDDELVTIAKLRDVWVHATGSVVGHLHPYFDPAVAWDETYALGESRSAEDRQTWEARVAKYAPELLGQKAPEEEPHADQDPQRHP